MINISFVSAFEAENRTKLHAIGEVYIQSSSELR